jgi:5-methylcytosine-specific restriction endonuclease McrA
MESLPAKTCTQCGELKLLTEYHKRSVAKSGLSADCKICNNAARAKYRAANYEADIEYKRKYSETNRITERLRTLEYSKNNRHVFSEGNRRRRARILGNGVQKYTTLQVLETYGTDCHICNGPVDMTAPRGIGKGLGWETGLHIDHVIPISKGGPDVLDNVRPSHSSCNLSKGGRVE